MGYHLANEFVTVTYNVQMVALSVRATLTAHWDVTCVCLSFPPVRRGYSVSVDTNGSWET